jgi:hypothetical protein
VRHTTITRCDERRTLDLNDDARLYGWSPLNFTGRAVYWVRSWWQERREPPAAGADVKITINTVDTGERRQIGSYSARHVITTITTDSSPDANTRPSESVQDGWHIDLPAAACRDAGDSQLFFATGSVMRAGAIPDRMTVEHRGAGRRGFPIEETTRRSSEHHPPITSRVTLIEFSEAVLDNSLFDVPKGYRPALPRLVGRVDMTKPDTVANRLAGYWEDVTTLGRDFLQF